MSKVWANSICPLPFLPRPTSRCRNTSRMLFRVFSPPPFLILPPPFPSHPLPPSLQANQLMQEYKLDSLARSDLEAMEEQIVTFTDIALDCVKLPGTRRPEMKNTARRLAALLSELKGEDKKKEAEEEAALAAATPASMENLVDEIAALGKPR